jgi:hypothetical protein
MLNLIYSETNEKNLHVRSKNLKTKKKKFKQQHYNVFVNIIDLNCEACYVEEDSILFIRAKLTIFSITQFFIEAYSY